MHLTQIEYLLAVYKYGSISKAAQELYTSQSTISSALKNLEEELNTTLFMRSKKGISFTAKGMSILQSATIITQEIKNIHKIAFSDDEILKEKLSLSTSSHFLVSLATDVTLHTKEILPNLEISIRRGSNKEVILDLANSNCDIGLLQFNEMDKSNIMNYLKRYQLEFHVTCIDSMCFAVCSNHPLLQKKNLTLREILQYPYLTLKEDIDEFTAQMLRDNGYTKEIISINDLVSQKKIMEKLYGSIMIPSLAIFEHNAITNQFQPLTINDFSCRCYIGWIQNNKPLSYAHKKWLMLLQEYFKTNFPANYVDT